MNKKENKPGTATGSSAVRKEARKVSDDFAFGRENYILMLIGIALIVIGFVLMSGGGSKVAGEWNPDIFSARRITIAPVLVILGFVVEVFAIVKKSKD